MLLVPPAHAQGQPLAPDENAVLLLHLDGNTDDASSHEIRQCAREQIIPDPRILHRREKDGSDALKTVEAALASIAKSKGKTR